MAGRRDESLAMALAAFEEMRKGREPDIRDALDRMDEIWVAEMVETQGAVEAVKLG